MGIYGLAEAGLDVPRTGRRGSQRCRIWGREGQGVSTGMRGLRPRRKGETRFRLAVAAQINDENAEASRH